MFDSHAPHSLPINKYKFVAPFWADADIRNSLQGQTGFHIGDVYYSQSTNPDLLARATNEIKEVFPQSEDFIITSLFIATWREVAYFSMHVNKVTIIYVLTLSLCVLVYLCHNVTSMVPLI